MTTIKMIKRWDIWLASVYYEDNPEMSKKRPVLVLESGECLVLSLKITSHLPRENYNGEYTVKKWKEAGLNRPSVIRTSQRFFIQKDEFIKKLGTLQKEDVVEIKNLIQKS